MNEPRGAVAHIVGLLAYLVGFTLLACELVGLWVAFGRGLFNGLVAFFVPPYAWILGAWQFWVWIWKPEMHP